MRTVRRARPRKRKKAARRAKRSTSAGVVIRRIVQKQPRPRKGTVVLGLRCRVVSIITGGEVLVLAEAFQGHKIAIPVPSPNRDGEQLNGLGLKEGQDVWLSLRA